MNIQCAAFRMVLQEFEDQISEIIGSGDYANVGDQEISTGNKILANIEEYLNQQE